MPALWPLSLQQRFDANGRPLAGAKAYFCDQGTLNARTVYRDPELATPHAHPVVADAVGAFPPVFVPTGQYRCRLTTSAGVLVFDVTLDGGEEATQGAGGTDANLLIKTGFVVAMLQDGTEAGYVRLNGRSIGSAASSATERANDDCEDLFVLLHTKLSNSIAAVSGGRGASAAADWTANKTLTLPSLRSRALVGLDTMGNSAASLLAGLTFGAGDATTPGAYGGAALHTLTANQIPIITPTGSGTFPQTEVLSSDVATGVRTPNAGAVANPVEAGSGVNIYPTSQYVAAYIPQRPVTLTMNSFGGGAPHPIMQPFALVTFYIKL